MAIWRRARTPLMGLVASAHGTLALLWLAGSVWPMAVAHGSLAVLGGWLAWRWEKE